MRCFLFLGAVAIALGAVAAQAAPYGVTRTVKVGGEGGFDYVYADAAGRRLYVPRLTQADVTGGAAPDDGGCGIAKRPGVSRIGAYGNGAATCIKGIWLGIDTTVAKVKGRHRVRVHPHR